MDSARFTAACVAFAAADAEDPRQLGDGQTRTAHYHRVLAGWVDRIAPGAEEVVRLAARCQHIRRFQVPRSTQPQGPAGYKRWRAGLALFHGEQAAAILGGVGYDADEIARVRRLLLKQGLGRDPMVQILEDAVCLTFLEVELETFAQGRSPEQVADILRKTWAKMSEAGHAEALALVPALPGELQALVRAALSVGA